MNTFKFTFCKSTPRAERGPFLFLLNPRRCRAKARCPQEKLSCSWLLPVGKAGPAKALISRVPGHPSSSLASLPATLASPWFPRLLQAGGRHFGVWESPETAQHHLPQWLALLQSSLSSRLKPLESPALYLQFPHILGPFLF